MMERRHFLRITSLTASGWVIAGMIPAFAFSNQTDDSINFKPSPLILMRDDGKIIIYNMKQEMGQSINTSLPLIVAEELEADPNDILTESLPYTSGRDYDYNTYASASVRTTYNIFRKAGATAKAMLIAAAAQQWNIPVDGCKAENSTVINLTTGQSLSYQSLLKKASTMDVPKDVVLKNPKTFKLIGKPQKKSNIKAIITGKNTYGIDVRLPEMLYATVVRSPVYKGKVIKWDDTALKQLDGIINIMELKEMGGGADNRNGVAIIAKNTWTALRAQQLLKVEWDYGPYANLNTDQLSQQLKTALSNNKPVLIDGGADLPTLTDATAISAVYELPYLAHLTMEPVNCTAWYKDGKYEIWGGFQAPGELSGILPKIFGVNKEDITYNLLPMGGAFGRKEKVDNATEAMLISRALGKPIQVVFSRADDTRADFYRPASYHRLTAVADKDGISQWLHQQAITTWPSHGERRSIAGPQDEVGGTSGDFYYPVQNFRSAFYSVESPLPIGSWRSIAYNHNTFVIESFIDELAHHNQIDPLQYRLNLFKQMQPGKIAGKSYFNPRRLEVVLQKCADEIGWHNKPGPGRYRGIACCAYLHTASYAANAFEISINIRKQITIHKAIAVMDCGTVIDPDGLKAQMEGSVVWGLSAALKGKITVTNGAVNQQSFFDYGVMHINEMPKLGLFVINSDEAPGGAGEPCVPAVAPALCSAIAAATGKRLRNLPILGEGYTLG